MPGPTPEGETELFDALRFSEHDEGPAVELPKPPVRQTRATLGPAPEVQLRENDPPIEADELVVELPEVFERPHSPILDRYEETDVITRHRLEEGPPPPAAPRTGLTMRAVVSLGVLAQVVILMILVAMAYCYPEKSAQVLHAAAAGLEADGLVNAESAEADESAREVLAIRMELINLEDRAVSQRDRSALAELMSLANNLSDSDPLLPPVRASLRRIAHYFAADPFGTPPELDAVSIYGADDEKKLPQTVVIQVLRDTRQPSEVRRRAAWLLAQNESSPAKKALLNTIRNDADLSVVQQAFDSFRKVTGYPAEEAFDVRSVELWWARSEAAALGQNGAPNLGGETLSIGP